jgi:hypothetical protein
MAKRISKDTKDKIISLRTRGYSLPELKKKFKIGYGTIYRYVQNIEILPRYRRLWYGKRGGSRKRQVIAEKKALKKAGQAIIDISDKELLLFVSALYWGEGSKSDFGLINSDAELIRVFVIALRRLFHITNRQLGVSVRIYEDLDSESCKQYWSVITGVPVNKFLGVTILKGKKNGKLPNGICRVRVKKGGNLLKYIKAIQLIVVKRVSPRSSTDRAEVS